MNLEHYAIRGEREQIYNMCVHYEINDTTFRRGSVLINERLA